VFDSSFQLAHAAMNATADLLFGESSKYLDGKTEIAETAFPRNSIT
jgi:hypothetical protein